MSAEAFNTALIVGAGYGLSASLARMLAKAGLKIALAARSPDDLAAFAGETGAKVFKSDASKAEPSARSSSRNRPQNACCPTGMAPFSSPARRPA